MLGLVKFLFLCFLAVAAGVAAVSIPIEGRTAAEHLRALVADAPALRATSAERAAPKVRAARAATPARERPPADAPTDEERKALDRLIGERVR